MGLATGPVTRQLHTRAQVVLISLGKDTTIRTGLLLRGSTARRTRTAILDAVEAISPTGGDEMTTTKASV